MFKLYSAVAAFIIVVFVAVALLSNGGNAPTNLAGTWKSSDGTPMVAHISANQIEIDAVDGDTSALYWKGTFNAAADNQVSLADKAALSKSMLGSQNSIKSFTYSNGELSYKLSMLGVTRTIHMKR